jgi:hypothetical protein
MLLCDGVVEILIGWGVERYQLLVASAYCSRRPGKPVSVPSLSLTGLVARNRFDNVANVTLSTLRDSSWVFWSTGPTV